jgi:HNH endonuclease
LRDDLLLWDRCCVLTSEKEATALEATHIVPVKAGGHGTIETTILLRADLHRLFDVGLFWFKLSADGAIVRHSKALSDPYNRILANAKLPNCVFKRVASALRHRAKLRCGTGAPSITAD